MAERPYGNLNLAKVRGNISLRFSMAVDRRGSLKMFRE
jgi:hypothetical protein